MTRAEAALRKLEASLAGVEVVVIDFLPLGTVWSPQHPLNETDKVMVSSDVWAYIKRTSGQVPR